MTKIQLIFIRQVIHILMV